MTARWSTVMVILALLLISGGSYYRYDEARARRPPELVRLAVPALPSSAVPILAQLNGIYAGQGLDVRLEVQPLGRDCIERLEKGQVDLAVAYDTPVVQSLMKGHDIVVLTELHTATENTAIVYRRDRGIANPADLRNRVVGMVAGTNAEFFLAQFLRANLMSPEELQLERVERPQLDDLLKNGRLDAAILWEPQVTPLLKAAPERYGVFGSPFYAEVSMLVARRAFLEAHRPRIGLLIKSLVEAQKSLGRSPRKSRQKVGRFLAERGTPVEPEAWDKFHLNLGMGSLLRAILEEEVRWYARHAKQPRPLDIKAHLEPEALKAHLPVWVTLQ